MTVDAIPATLVVISKQESAKHSRKDQRREEPQRQPKDTGDEPADPIGHTICNAYGEQIGRMIDLTA